MTGYEDGSERPTRPKFDAADAITSLTLLPSEPCDGCNGGYIPPKSNFVSSVGLGAVSNNPWDYIYALRIINGNNSEIQPSEGHIKINVDLNKGAGGDYIYLTFTRDAQYSYENDGAHPAVTYSTPITKIMVEAHTQFGNINDGAPLLNTYRHMYKFDGERSYPVDLNRGAGGRYIYGQVTREALNGNPIKEIGVLYGNSSSIQPPDASWVKVDRDLNEGAGGDYIYFCFKR